MVIVILEINWPKNGKSEKQLKVRTLEICKQRDFKIFKMKG